MGIIGSTTTKSLSFAKDSRASLCGTNPINTPETRNAAGYY